MSAPTSLSAALESAGESLESSQVSTAPESTDIGQAPVEPEIGFVGFQPEQPTAAQTFRLSDGLTDDTVVAFDGDKPITAKEVKDGYFRQSDYSRKTQELADQRKNIEAQTKWFEENRTYIDRLGSNDPTQKAAALTELIDAFGVRDQIAKSFTPAAEKPRGVDGKFAAKTSELLNPDDYDDDTRPVVAQANAAIQRANDLENLIKSQGETVSRLEQTLGQFQHGLQSAQQQQQQTQELTSLAEGWQKSGFKDIDLQSAMGLIGQTITPMQAMLLAHQEKLLAHNYRAAEAKFKGGSVIPNEPGAIRSTQRQSELAGKSLNERLQAAERFGN